MAQQAIDAPEELHVSILLRRVSWIVAAGAWLFVVLALASFDRADAPSHAVALSNDLTQNLCGAAGAALAFWSYHVVGPAVWLIVAGGLVALVVRARGATIGHPLVRTLGLLLATGALAGIHALLFPRVGPLPPLPSGLVGSAVVAELLPRFAGVGTFLFVAAGFAVGAIVAADRYALALPRVLISGVLALRGVPTRLRAAGDLLLAGPRASIAFVRSRGASAQAADDDGYEYEYEYEDEDEDVEDDVDPDADEDEYEYEDDDYEYEDEDEDGDYEYEDDDDEEEEDADEDDEEYEYEDEDEDEEELRPAAQSGEAKDPRTRLTPEELRAKIAKLPVKVASRKTSIARDEDIPRTESFKKYPFPTLDLLHDPESNFSERMESQVRAQAESLEQSLQTFGIDAEVTGIESGPAVTLYSVQLAPGTKVSRVSAISSDIARSLRAQNIRIVPNMVGKTTIGIEVPNLTREKVRLKELMSGGHANGMVLPMFLGKDAAGEPLVADLTRMPHMLIAGTTGSGKSVCMNTILMSWLYTKRPDELKLVLVDPKMVEMSQFSEIPHLMCPVVTESPRAAAIMEWAVDRMEERYELLREARVQNIGAYNRLTEEELYEIYDAQTDEEKARIPKKLPYMVFVVDELADLMMTCKEVEQSIVRIAQKARAVGIHLILATQRPQANVVTGLIKSNMPCRVSFKVASGMDSRIVLDSKGAELLLGQGDMMFLTPSTSELRRAQGTLVEDTEIRKVTKFLKTVAAPNFERSLIAIRPGGDANNGNEGGLEGERDPLFDRAVEIIIDSGRGSVSLLQRRLSIGYGRASRLVDQMGLAGIVGNHKGSVAREVMITLEDWHQMKAMEDDAEREGTVFERDADDDPPSIHTNGVPSQV